MINAEELIQRINEQIENFGWDDFGTGWKSACSTIILIVEAMDKENEKEYSTREDTIRDHEYIILNGMYLGNIIHSESCPCKKGGNNE